MGSKARAWPWGVCLRAQQTMAEFLEDSNGRFDKLVSERLRGNWKEEMTALACRQQMVGAKNLPVLAIWGVDIATDAQLQKLKEVVTHFLAEAKPTKLMLSGRRASSVAQKAELLLRRVLSASTSKPQVIISGGADGVDSVALRLTDPSQLALPNLGITGQYTPTPFARADVLGKGNTQPEELRGLSPGASPLIEVAAMPVPAPGGEGFAEFIAQMEGQWEARDTYNAEQADAVLAFLTADGRKGHDGTKATLNIFAVGRYAHPPRAPSISEWEVEPDSRSVGVHDLGPGDGEKFVGYKLFRTKSVNKRHLEE